MINMDYCRFENTLHAMEECLNHIEECEETSDREIKYAKRLYEACKEFIDRCNDNGIKKYEDEGYVMSSCLLKEGLSDNKKWLWGSTKCVRAISHHDNSVDF